MKSQKKEIVVEYIDKIIFNYEPMEKDYRLPQLLCLR